MASWRVPLTLMGLALAILACATIATAGPDPPHVDGGSTTFAGDWTVDPLDDLLYVNQTIVLDGDLTVDENGTLELRNCTLVMNSTSDGQYSIEVRANGSLRSLQGTTVTCRVENGDLGPRFMWTVRASGRVVLDGSRIVGAGWDAGHPGLVLEGGGSVLERSSLEHCYRALTALGGSSGVENLTVSNCTEGILWRGSSSTLANVSCLDCTYAGIVLEGCDQVTVADMMARRCGEGLRVAANATGVVVLGADVALATIGINCSSDGALIERLTAQDCDVGLRLSGDDSGATGVTVRLSGASPRATAGVLVTDGAQRVRLENLDISGPDDAVLVLGDCSGLRVLVLRVRSAVDGALALDASPSRASDVRLERLTLAVAGASYGVLVRSVDALTIDTADILGPPSYAIDLLDCADAVLSSVQATASQRVVSVDGSGVHRNVTVTGCDLEGGEYGLWAEDLIELTVEDSILLDSTTDCLMARRVAGVRIALCAISGGLRSGIELFSCQDVLLQSVTVSDIPYPVYMEGTSNASVKGCTIDTCDTGMWFMSCAQLELQDAAVVGSDVAFLFNATSDLRVFSALANVVTGTALVLEGGTTDAVIDVCEVNSGGTGVRLSGAGTSSVLIRGLELDNCTEGVNATGAGSDIVVNATSFLSLAVGVSATGGSEVRVEDGSFMGCAMALRSDAGSWLNWTIASPTDLEDCSSVLRGRIELLDGGELNVTRSKVAFISGSDLESGVASGPVSALRLTTSSFSAVAGSSFHISSSGELDVRDCNISGGTRATTVGALTVRGDAAWVGSTTFGDCAVAVLITGDFATVAGCDFAGSSRADIMMDGALRPTISGCDFLVTSVGITGTFEGSLSVSSSYLDGMGGLVGALALGNDPARTGTLTLRNVTMAHYGEAGAVADHHQGSTLIEDCVLLDGASLDLAPRGGGLVQLRHLVVTNSSVGLGGVSFVVEGCAFNGSGLQIADCPQGGLVYGCAFEGTLASGATIGVKRSRFVTVEVADIDVDAGAVAVTDGSGLRIVGSSIRCSGIALDVDSSQLLVESCGLLDVAGGGLRATGVSATAEMSNCSVSIGSAGTGRAVEVTSNAEAWFINTTFNRTSVLTADSGRFHVIWFATFELRLPWGGTIDRPTRFVITEAQGDEVVNTTDARDTFLLHELLEDSGARTYLTPHALVVEDASRGVRWEGTLTFNRTRDVTIDLLDVELPQARAGPDQIVSEDSLVALDGLASSDNDPTFGTSGTFGWSYDEYGTLVTLSGARVVHVFSVPGDFSLTLTVVDGSGNVGVDWLVVQVLDTTPPVIVYEGNVTVDEDTPHIFDASATTDNDPRYSAPGGTFIWEFHVPGGPVTLEGAAVTALFPTPGTYRVDLTVKDRENNTAEAQFSVTVLDRTPPDIIGVRDTTVYDRTSNLLDASRCVDNVGITTYRWVVGHGSNTSTMEGPAPQFTFDALGIYNVTLTVEDAAHNANRTTVVVVYDDIPVITLPPRVVAMALAPLEVPIKVADEFNQGLVFRLAIGPEGVTFVPSADGAMLLWTPQGGPGGYESMDIMFDVAVNDGYVDAVGRMMVWVNPARGAGNHAPVISSAPPLAAKRAAPYIYTVLATDPDGDRLGYVLVAGPAGMAVSVEGTVSWTPPFESGTILVHVDLAVTDGQAIVSQGWDVRFREPPNQAPRITFSIPSMEVKVHEEFTVDLSPFLPDSGAYQVDADDPNLVLVWSVRYNASAVGLLSQDRLLFRFQALTVSEGLELEFVVTDPSGANDTTTMALTVLPLPVPGGDGDLWPWLLLALVVVGAVSIAGAGISVSRRRRRLAAAEARMRARVVAEAEQPTFEPTTVPAAPAPVPQAIAATAVVAGAEAPTAGRAGLSDESVAIELDEEMLTDELDELISEVGTFQEIPAAPQPRPVRTPEVDGEWPQKSLRDLAAAAIAEPAETSAPPEPRPALVARPFILEGVAVLGKDGRTMASTGRVDEVIGPVQKAVMDVLAARDATNDATLEVEGRRVIVMARDGMGVVGIIRGKEDGDLRPQISAALDNMHAHPDRDGALEVIEDLLAASGGGARAEVVKGAWTAHLHARVDFKGHHVVLEAFIRNDTDALMHNVRADLSYDHDALALASVRPRLLVSQDRVSVGNLPPGKSTELEVSFIAELCLSSPMSVLVSYTDPEGHRVQVPARPMRVDVHPPRLQSAGAPTDQELLALASGGLSQSGRRGFTYAVEAARAGVHAIGVRKARDAGLVVVRELDSQETMRSESWLAGAAVEGGARAIARVSAHGADRLLEVFVASDDASIVVGLLTALSGAIMDAVGSESPVAVLQRVRDARLLSDLEVWPTLLEYELDGG